MNADHKTMTTVVRLQYLWRRRAAATTRGLLEAAVKQALPRIREAQTPSAVVRLVTEAPEAVKALSAALERLVPLRKESAMLRSRYLNETAFLCAYAFGRFTRPQASAGVLEQTVAQAAQALIAAFEACVADPTKCTLQLEAALRAYMKHFWIWKELNQPKAKERVRQELIEAYATNKPASVKAMLSAGLRRFPGGDTAVRAVEQTFAGGAASKRARLV